MQTLETDQHFNLVSTEMCNMHNTSEYTYNKLAVFFMVILHTLSSKSYRSTQ